MGGNRLTGLSAEKVSLAGLLRGRGARGELRWFTNCVFAFHASARFRSVPT